MPQQDQPVSVAYWVLDDTTGAARELSSYTNWQDE